MRHIGVLAWWWPPLVAVAEEAKADPWWIAWLGVLGVAVGAVGGYGFRRRETLRDRRIDAFREALTTFYDAARQGAALYSVFFQLSWFEDIRVTPDMTDEQRVDVEAKREAYRESWQRAADARRGFELAAHGADLVAGRKARIAVQQLRTYLHDALFSGSPWTRGAWPNKDVIPNLKLSPSQIEPMADELLDPFVRQAAAELWGGSWWSRTRDWWTSHRKPLSPSPPPEAPPDGVNVADEPA